MRHLDVYHNGEPVGVEEKVLLAIRHIVIRDMQERLRRHSIVNGS